MDSVVPEHFLLLFRKVSGVRLKESDKSREVKPMKKNERIDLNLCKFNSRES